MDGFSGLAQNLEGGTSVSWDEDPWSLGAWAYYAPGDMKALFPHAARQEGRVTLRVNTRLALE
jgi:monoamine oxidase